MSASRCAVRLVVSVVVGMMAPFPRFLVDASVDGRDDRDVLWCMGVLAAVARGDPGPARALLALRAGVQPRSPVDRRGDKDHDLIFLELTLILEFTTIFWAGVYSRRRPAEHFACVHLGGPVRRLVASATYRPKGGDMEHSHRQIGQRVQAARERAIICHVYG